MAGTPIFLLQVFLLCKYSRYLPTNPRYVYCFQPWNNKTICLSVCTPFGVDFPILFELDLCFRFRIDSTLGTCHPSCFVCPHSRASFLNGVQFRNHQTYWSLLTIPHFNFRINEYHFLAINLFCRRLNDAFSKHSKEPERQKAPAGLRMVQSSPYQLCHSNVYSWLLLRI